MQQQQNQNQEKGNLKIQQNLYQQIDEYTLKISEEKLEFKLKNEKKINRRN